MQLFDNNILNSIKNLESPTSIINDILDEDEIQKLINFEQNATERFADRDDARKTGLGKNGKVETDTEKWDPEIKDLLVNKIQKLIGDFSIADDEYPPHFFRTTFPLSIHADTGHDGNAVVYKQLLFPLESTPTGKAKTIILQIVYKITPQLFLKINGMDQQHHSFLEIQKEMNFNTRY